MKNSVRKKQFGKIGKLAFSIVVIIMIGYLIAPYFHVPAEYIILPLMTTLTAGMLSTRANRLINSLSILAPGVMLDEDTKCRQEAEMRVASLKEIDKKNKTSQYSELVYELEVNLSICEHLTDVSAQSLIPILMRDIKTLMRIPSRTLSDFIASKYKEKEILALRDKMLSEARILLSPYDHKSREKLARFISDIVEHILPIGAYKPKFRVKPILLVGPPGVGKTYLVQELTRIFWMTLCKIEMGKFNLEEFEGRQLPGSSGPTSRPGTIMATQTNKFINEKECSDLVLMLDELDKCFQKNKEGPSDATTRVIGLLHPLLQVDTLSLQDKGYNIPLSIKNTIVICTANRNCFDDDYLEKTTRESLKDRVTVVNMPPLKKEGKLGILCKNSKEIVLRDKNTDLVQKRLILRLMNVKAKLIAEFDKNPGLRDALDDLEHSYSDSLTANLHLRDGFKSISGRILSFLGPKTSKIAPLSILVESPTRDKDSVYLDILDEKSQSSLKERLLPAE